MPSENKTPNIGLNQWLGNEYPKRQDFVDDNLIIDAELKKINAIDFAILADAEEELESEIPRDSDLLGGKPKSYFEGLVQAVSDRVIANLNSINTIKGNFTKFGQFAIQNNDFIIGTETTSIPLTRVLSNPDNYYTINANGIIIIPPGTYVISANVHGAQGGNDFLGFNLVCSTSVSAAYPDPKEIVKQYEIALNIIVKSDVYAPVQLIVMSTSGTSTVYGYNTAVDTQMTILKIS